MAIPRAKRGVLDNYVQCRIRIVQRELLNHFRPLKPNHHHRGRWNIERTNERLTDDHSIRIWPSIHRSFVRSRHQPVLAVVLHSTSFSATSIDVLKQHFQFIELPSNPLQSEQIKRRLP